MYQVSNKLFITSFVLCLASICLWFFSGKAAVQSPTVTIEAQSSDNPLRIQSAQVSSVLQSPRSDAVSVTVTVNMQVQSQKPISAYTVGFKLGSSDSPLRGGQLTNILSVEQALKPGQVRSVSLHVTQPLPAENIVPFIDFVEFMDGSTWGADAFKSRERLAGQRAGSQAIIDRLKEITDAEGDAALMRSVTEDLPIPKPHDKSREWEEGFETGIEITRNRFKKAHQNGGEFQVRNELKQKYDSFQGRQKQ
jgi:hypothetical protein